jgi:hypothetical protein
MSVYQQSVVAFIDFLGFQEALKIEENAKYILELLQKIKLAETTKSHKTIQYNESTHTLSLTPTMTAFSDNIVISFSENDIQSPVTWCHAVIEMLNICRLLSNHLIEKGFLFRGGITLGRLYHENGVVFGESLVEAYILESKKAAVPRVLASQKLVDCFNANKNGGTQECFLQDEDGLYHLDYLQIAIQYSDLKHVYAQTIQQTLSTKIHDEQSERIHTKWLWFKRYFELTCQKIDTL